MEPHVAVLVLDTPIAGVAETFGDFGDNAISLLGRSKCGFVKYQVAFDVTMADRAEQNAQGCQRMLSALSEGIRDGAIKGAILTGSRTDSFLENHPWIAPLDKFIQTTLFNTPNFPMVGLCFGHQILAKNLGCKVNRNSPENGWEAGTTTISLNKSILDIPGSPFRSALKTEDGKILQHINLVEFHRDIVYGMPPASTHSLLSGTSFQNLGSTAKCSIQGLITESGPIKVLTFQGHPEFTTAESLNLLELMAQEQKIDKGVFERLTYNTRNLENQGPIVGKVIQEFIESHIQF
ncbi:class I glutamine amidotransferase-like protein [Metschnikowia bicuspidata var. bicuspidata NRRL YB-4993]|uniref:Class I glutamine amidotransferase-like protein n=1 Tax=Metschnikowia bicuspidata var. bicuspidata NRRL YB-4993 TaxID=869754 RepID=A0A1A0GZ49_9ASCO|nr:class I glutamine amidotransferase-like protein [Metschnikowia bicuspidata var. bicuspidata NRRL YB-4993]OBA17003.1 class I glutamine amidotransferase-like protein [Metschnikowia bicuspidata var. bicuspidata NRRL YB-4993]